MAPEGPEAAGLLPWLRELVLVPPTLSQGSCTGFSLPEQRFSASCSLHLPLAQSTWLVTHMHKRQIKKAEKNPLLNTKPVLWLFPSPPHPVHGAAHSANTAVKHQLGWDWGSVPGRCRGAEGAVPPDPPPTHLHPPRGGENPPPTYGPSEKHHRQTPPVPGGRGSPHLQRSTRPGTGRRVNRGRRGAGGCSPSPTRSRGQGATAAGSDVGIAPQKRVKKLPRRKSPGNVAVPLVPGGSAGSVLRSPDPPEETKPDEWRGRGGGAGTETQGRERESVFNMQVSESHFGFSIIFVSPPSWTLPTQMATRTWLPVFKAKTSAPPGLRCRDRERRRGRLNLQGNRGTLQPRRGLSWFRVTRGEREALVHPSAEPSLPAEAPRWWLRPGDTPRSSIQVPGRAAEAVSGGGGAPASPGCSFLLLLVTGAGSSTPDLAPELLY